MSTNPELIRVYCTPWCQDCNTAKMVLTGERVPFENIDITDDPDLIYLVKQENNGNQSVPTILFPDGRKLTEPTIAELRATLK